MTKTEQNLLSMNSTMTEAELQDAIDLNNASFVQVILLIDFSKLSSAPSFLIGGFIEPI